MTDKYKEALELAKKFESIVSLAEEDNNGVLRIIQKLSQALISAVGELENYNELRERFFECNTLKKRYESQLAKAEEVLENISGCTMTEYDDWSAAELQERALELISAYFAEKEKKEDGK